MRESLSSYVPGLSGAADEEVGVRVAKTSGGLVDSVLDVDVPSVGRAVEGRVGVARRVGVTSSSGISVSGMDVEIPGSVPRRIKVNGVAVSRAVFDLRELARFANRRTRQMPNNEKIPNTIGMINVASNFGLFSIAHNFFVDDLKRFVQHVVSFAQLFFGDDQRRDDQHGMPMCV